MKNILYQELIVQTKHLLRIMKISMLALFVCVTGILATEANSQNALVSIVADKITTQEVINEIEKQTDYLFVFDRNEVNLNREVSIRADRTSVSQVLNNLFKDTDVAYDVVGKNILLAHKTTIKQQDSWVSGVVVDESGETVIGANVMVKGTSTGSITDIDGKFSLNAPADAVLQISFIGYITRDVPVNGQTNLHIVLREDTKALDEVVVVGYGIQKKSVVTAAVSRVDAEDLVRNNPPDIRYALQGKATGVQITSNSGQPGSEAVFRIRGTGTINNNTPLFLIDGFPAESAELNSINPTDISSIEILKDAASAAIYGARAANGVVLITTKEGKAGKASVTYDFSYELQNPWKKMELTNAVQYQSLINEAYENAGQAGPYANPLVSDVDTDWQELIINNNAPIMNHQLSISGGTEDISYYVSFGALSQDGMFAKGKSFYDRYSFRSNTNMKVYEAKNRNYLNKVTLGVNLSFVHTSIEGIDANSEWGGPIGSAIMAPPNIAPYVDDAETIAYYDEVYPGYVRQGGTGRVYTVINNLNEITNPLATMEILNRHNTNQRYNGNFSLTADLLPGLTFKSNAGVSYGNRQRREWTPAFYLSSYRNNSTSSVMQRRDDGFRWQWENILSYSNTFGENTMYPHCWGLPP